MSELLIGGTELFCGNIFRIAVEILPQRSQSFTQRTAIRQLTDGNSYLCGSFAPPQRSLRLNFYSHRL